MQEVGSGSGWQNCFLPTVFPAVRGTGLCHYVESVVNLPQNSAFPISIFLNKKGMLFNQDLGNLGEEKLAEG